MASLFRTRFTVAFATDARWSIGSIPSSRGVCEAGKILYLAVAAPERVPQLPDVPTVAEAGGPAGLDVNSFVMLPAPKGLPAPLAAKIGADVAAAVDEPDVKARFDSFAFEPIRRSPREIVRNAELKSKVHGELVPRGNISLD